MNVSRETARWLVERSGTPRQPKHTESARPTDIHVDWSAIDRDSIRLTHIGRALADLLKKHGKNVDLTVGIEKAGVPIATVVSTLLPL
ncbi:hypothetical protein BRD19_06365 [Halobacteriales archaeon SW_7_65_23]|nr:MAG: hypothetical protein BRD19_06365 [Halobacteriales archaeon SW_7_65_23]